MTSPALSRVLPDEPARWALLAAASTAFGVCVGPTVLGVTRLGVMSGVAVHRRARTTMLIAGVFVVLGIGSGSAAAMRVATTRTSSVAVGGVELTFRVVEDVRANRYGIAVGAPRLIDGQPWNGPRIAVEGLDESTEVGSTVTAGGSLRSSVRRIRDEIVADTFSIEMVEAVHPSRNPAFVVGNAIRRRVQTTFESNQASDGLIIGLLIGDTRRLGAVDLENLRRSGLAHFVAVSGENAGNDTHIVVRSDAHIAGNGRVCVSPLQVFEPVEETPGDDWLKGHTRTCDETQFGQPLSIH